VSQFQFKQFTIHQSRTPMKVGTDAMILGAWTDVNHVDTILDIGTGTGVLALMLAQRCDAMTIDAVEIVADAYEEAVENFENSPWSDRLFCYHASVQELAAATDEGYDVIICNPPYFPPSKIKSYNGRTLARETHLLNHLTLLKNTKKLLSPNGTCAFSIPFEIESFFIELAQNMGLYLQRRMRMRDKMENEPVRSFLQFGFNKKEVADNILTLKEADNSYTEQYKDLTKEFYILF